MVRRERARSPWFLPFHWRLGAIRFPEHEIGGHGCRVKRNGRPHRVSGHSNARWRRLEAGRQANWATGTRNRHARLSFDGSALSGTTRFLAPRHQVNGAASLQAAASLSLKAWCKTDKPAPKVGPVIGVYEICQQHGVLNRAREGAI